MCFAKWSWRQGGGDEVKDTIEFFAQQVGEFEAKYRKCGDFRERYAVWTKLIEKYSSRGAVVLDVGCGAGTFSFAAAKFNRTVIGIDSSPQMIEFCKQRRTELMASNVSFFCRRLETLPQAGLAKADLLLCSSVLEYVDDLRSCLDVLAKLLNRGGHLIVSFPNKSAIYLNLERLAFRLTGRRSFHAYMKNILTVDELTRQVIPLGASLVEAHFYGKNNVVFRALNRLADVPVLNNMFVAVYRMS